MNDIKGNEVVSLFSREFLGIDKECDEKCHLNNNDYNILEKTKGREKVSVLFKFIFLLVNKMGFYPFIFCMLNNKEFSDLLIFYMLIILFILFVFITCKSIFLGIMIGHYLAYDCYDNITNEVFRKENEKTKNSNFYIFINLGIEIFVFLFNIIYMQIFFLVKRSKKIKKILRKETITISI